MDSGRRQLRKTLGVRSRQTIGTAGGQNYRVGANARGSVCAGQTGTTGIQAGRRGGSICPHSSGGPRPDRPAADPGRGGRIRQRQPTGGIRALCRSNAREGHLWRALGPLVAGPRPLRRLSRLRRRSATNDLGLSRLRDQVVQQEQAVRPVYHRTTRGGPAAQADRRTTGRHGLQPQHDDQQRGRHQR